MDTDKAMKRTFAQMTAATEPKRKAMPERFRLKEDLDIQILTTLSQLVYRPEHSEIESDMVNLDAHEQG